MHFDDYVRTTNVIGIFKFEAIYQDRVWGGRALAELFGRTLPPGRIIGESWEIVDRPEAQAKVRGGPDSGQSLRALIETRGPEIPQRALQASAAELGAFRQIHLILDAA